MSQQDTMQRRQDYARQLRQASRFKFKRINSLDLIPEEDVPSNVALKQFHIASGQHQQQLERAKTKRTLGQHLQNFLLFWPHLLLRIFLRILRFILFIPLSIAAPSFWLSALLWIFWKLMRVPVAFVKWVLGQNTFGGNINGGTGNTPRRTILLSCGSTIQTLHLARNFYSSGARVVVFEFEGLFGLARFSTAVDKFYLVPRPTSTNVENYIAAICQIVQKEKPSVYIPVCASSPAYYDALAKPHLELLGCASFIPGPQEAVILDDCLQFYQKCAAQSIALPPYTVLSSPGDLYRVYESGFISNFRNILMAVGMHGILERYKYILPNRRQDLKFNHEINERQQWMVVRDQPGYHHYVTCTTVKDSRVVSNVTCKVEHRNKNLVPVLGKRRNVTQGNNADADDEAQIELWLRTFFAKVRFQRSINGHISFRLVKSACNGQFLPLGVRLGVSLPYICYNRSHAQVLCRTMKCVHVRHLSHSHSHDEDSTLTNTFSWSTIEHSSAETALDKREALFAYWDPLPYCAYYHFQLPLESVKLFLQKRNPNRTTAKSLSPRITVPVH